MKIIREIYLDILLTALRGRITPRMKIIREIYLDILLTVPAFALAAFVLAHHFGLNILAGELP